MKKNTFEEIISTIKSLKTGKSAGLDMISAEFFKSIATDIALILKDVFNSILDSGVFPKCFGETILCPLHKSGPTSDPNNFSRYIISKYNVQNIFKCFKQMPLRLGLSKMRNLMSHKLGSELATLLLITYFL